MGAENSSEEIDVKNKDVQDIEHEDIKENIVRCSECKKVLPNDHKAIKHHMINEHIKPKQKSIVIDATLNNELTSKPNNR
jgi:ribosomal protein S26